MKLNFTLAVLICFLYGTAFSQQLSLRGKVVDDKNLPVPGASVLLKGTSQGTTTSAEGTFNLNAPANGTIVISGIGYVKQEVPVSGKNFLEIHLESDDLSLEEVVINGAYITSDKKSYTGSASVVTADKLMETQPTNITQALQGAAPGVQVLNTSGSPGADATIRIRGTSSVQGGNDPLYIIDGMPYNGDLASINPNDMESVTVLKDASATTLYGSRAANGVIVMTTKKGKTAEPVVNLRSNFGWSDLAVAYPDKANPQQLLELSWEALRNGALEDPNISANTPEEAAQWATDHVIQEYFQQPWQSPYGNPKPIGLDGKLVPGSQLLFSGDWFGEYFKPRLRQDYTVDISGASGEGNKTQYFISGGYLNDKGYFKVQGYERYSGRVNISSQVKKWLNVGTNVSYNHSFQQNPNVQARFTRTMPSIYPVYQWDYDNGEYVRDPYGNLMPDFGNDTRVEWRGWAPGFVGDYKNDSDWDFNGQQRDNLSTRSFMEITFMPGLKLRTGLSTDYQLNYNHSYGSATLTTSSSYGGSASRTANRRFIYTLNNLLTYDKSIGLHHFNVLLGQEIYKAKYVNENAGVRGFATGGLFELGAASELRSISSSEDNYRIASYFSNVSYDFDGKYYANASYRRDGSSRFAPQNRWGSFWSVGAGWIISAEDFMKNASWVNNLKVRASHGTVGNDQVPGGYYSYQGLYEIRPVNSNGTSTGWSDNGAAGVILSTVPTPNVIWEGNEQTDAGIDFDLFGRVHGSLDWFNRKSKDLIFQVPLPTSVGLDDILQNIGDNKNTGLELDVNVDILRGHALRWNIDVNASHYKNTITTLPQDEIYTGRYKRVVGKSIYEFFLPEWAGVNPETGNNQWWQTLEDGSRVKTEVWTDVNNNDQKHFVGHPMPDLFGAVTNSFSYKGIDFSFMFYYSLGGKIYDADYAEGVRYRRGFNMSTQILDRWTPENPNTRIPRLSTYTMNNVGVASTQYLFDNSFLRLRNVSIGYTLPNNITDKIGVNRVKIFAQGTNLLTWGNAANRGTDPETQENGAVGNGTDGNGQGSVRKSWSFGLQASF